MLGISTGRHVIAFIPSPGAEVLSVPFVHCAPARAHVRPWLSAMAAVALLLVAFVGPTAAHRPIAHEAVVQDGSARLREAGVSPRLARTSTTIRFSVSYRDPGGLAPRWVRVVVAGRSWTMTTTGARDARLGLRFIAASKLPVGSYRVRFRAMSGKGALVATPAGTLRVVRAVSSDGGSSSSRPDSSGATEGADGSSGGADASGSAVTGTSGSTAATTSDVSAAHGSPGLAAEDPQDAAGTPLLSPPNAGPLAPALLAESATDPGASSGTGDRVGARGAGGVSGSGGAGATGGAPAAPVVLDALGLGNGLVDRVFQAYPMLVTTTGTTIVWAAFVIFGRRRRDGDPPLPEPVLAANAAASPDPIPSVELVPPEAHPNPVPPGVDPSEASLPRWRRPSLLQARKTDPLRTAIAPASLTFADGEVQPVDGKERRRIRYRLVGLLDLPDEVRANEIAILDEGDEVQLLEAHGTYRLVLCPDGQQGWLHKMVLGDLVGEGDGPAAPAGIDEDVLAAFITAHQRTA
jgi:hypothetical protein